MTVWNRFIVYIRATPEFTREELHVALNVKYYSYKHTHLDGYRAFLQKRGYIQRTGPEKYLVAKHIPENASKVDFMHIKFARPFVDRPRDKIRPKRPFTQVDLEKLREAVIRNYTMMEIYRHLHTTKEVLYRWKEEHEEVRFLLDSRNLKVKPKPIVKETVCSGLIKPQVNVLPQGI